MEFKAIIHIMISARVNDCFIALGITYLLRDINVAFNADSEHVNVTDFGCSQRCLAEQLAVVCFYPCIV